MILLVEPCGGMAGDMFLAALLDLGHPGFTPADLEALARALVPEALDLAIEETERGGFRVRTLRVETRESHHPPHRHLSDLLALLAASPLSTGAAARAGRVLRRLAEAESRAHGIAVEEVHFHEVGAIDTLIDVGGALLALERLGVERVLATPPYVGGGTVRCAHGELPVPAPGTAELLRGMPHRRGPGGERLTPTGAALLAELAEAFEPEETLVVEREGYGGGQRDPEEGPGNWMRVALCRGGAPGARAEVWQLACNLDDLTGEELAFLAEGLRAAGALDVWTVPVVMKKGRPGVVIEALARAAQRAALEEVLLRHSSSLGVRWTRCERREWERAELTVELHGAPVRVKHRRSPAGAPSALDLSPEQDDLAALARATGIDLRTLEHAAVELARARLG